MGMYDTLLVRNCPNCGCKTEIQTKLGSRLLNYYNIGSTTTIPDGIYRAKDGCHKCNHYSTFVIAGGKFLAILKDAPEQAVQEMPFGGTQPIGTDPEAQIIQFVKNLKQVFGEFKNEDDDK